MIKELDNNVLSMYQGDTGTISFKMTGDCSANDTYVFSIKQFLTDTTPLITKTFKFVEFTVDINEQDSKLLSVGDYYWGIKVLRSDDSGNEIDTIVGRGILNVRIGV